MVTLCVCKDSLTTKYPLTNFSDHINPNTHYMLSMWFADIAMVTSNDETAKSH